jgi:hypothetical protein
MGSGAGRPAVMRLPLRESLVSLGCAALLTGLASQAAALEITRVRHAPLGAWGRRAAGDCGLSRCRTRVGG